MVAMDSSRRSEPQQFKSITVLRRPVFVGSKPKENGVLAPAGSPSATCARRWAAKKLKQLEDENRKLKHVVAELTLDKRLERRALKKLVATSGRRELGGGRVPDERAACLQAIVGFAAHVSRLTRNLRMSIFDCKPARCYLGSP